MIFLTWISVLTIKAADIFVDTESFNNKGGWVVDQQYMDLMGSPYLLAHGMGQAVADASTKIYVSEQGYYNIYVRTYNWTSPWRKGKGPGGFQVKCGNHLFPNVLGNTGNHWEWQYVGKRKLKRGKILLTLHDLSGFDGRCDAMFLTTDRNNKILSYGKEETKSLRMACHPELYKNIEEIKTDFAIVGGGIAGMCAAASAARLGCKTVLINDRSVLGGNNSSEVRVHLGGIIEIGPNKGLGRMIREFGHSRSGNARPAEYYEDAKKDSFIRAEHNIVLLENEHADSIEMDGDRIKAIYTSNILTGQRKRIVAHLVADCTGDGTIGYLAGADYLMGRESTNEYGESLAPEIADNLVMGASLQWYSKDVGKKVIFPEFSYGLHINSSNCEKVTMGGWNWETGMNRNQITDAEKIRDYGLLIVYSNWSFLKNHLTDDNSWKTRHLEWVAYIAGKRESRRIIGDYILKQDDIDKDVFHEDASFCTTWSIDLHLADSTNSMRFPGNEFKTATVHRFIHPYNVPYRCLYSRNIGNLFMAGRDISVTHVALGTVRVMRTTGMMGEVVGMAASLCKEHNCTPREIYQHYLPQLKKLMQMGVGKNNVPDNQHFNEPNKLLPKAKALK